MKSIVVRTGALTTLSLVGTLAVEGSAPSPAAPSPAPDGVSPPAWTCSQGPARVSDMDETQDGFLRYQPQAPTDFHEFYFTRAIYSGGRRGGFGFYRRRGGGDYLGDRGPSWSIDYPNSDRHMMQVAQRLSVLDACEWEHPVSLADPELRRFPFLYSLEWGGADLTDAEVEGLRSYLEAGGLLMIDDFWGTREWFNFQEQMARVFPKRPIVEIPRDNLLFHIHYDIKGDLLQVPNVGNGRAVAMGYPGATTSEQDGYVPHLRGIFDDKGRLLVVINWNTDLGDALEWAEDPYYPLEYSTFASEIFLNTIMYAMSQ